jgi:uncharacterized protein (DUF305 family)
LTLSGAAAVACFLAGTATVQTNALSPTTPPGKEQRMTAANDTKEAPPTPATRAYMAAALQMHKDMAVRYTGNADKDFAATMAAHHKGAIEMAKVELKYGTDPDMRKLAQQIVDDNEKEIALMRAWEAKRP